MSESPNKNNKDRLFKMIYGREENKAWTLSLYNAVNGSNYTNPDDIKINTIDDVMYLGMKNDVSFIISETMNIYCHKEGPKRSLGRYLMTVGLRDAWRSIIRRKPKQGGGFLSFVKRRGPNEVWEDAL